MTHTLPIITVQPDFVTVIDDVHSGIIPSDTFWVSCYKTSEPSIHAKVDVELDENDRDLVRLLPKDGDVKVRKDGVSNVDIIFSTLCHDALRPELVHHCMSTTWHTADPYSASNASTCGLTTRRSTACTFNRLFTFALVQ
jgi:hypothetical protein